MIDLGHAKEEFEHYLDGYDRENDKVKLKIIHTYGVVECSRKFLFIIYSFQLKKLKGNNRNSVAS